jgi:hypothetical protein
MQQQLQVRIHIHIRIRLLDLLHLRQKKVVIPFNNSSTEQFYVKVEKKYVAVIIWIQEHRIGETYVAAFMQKWEQ